MQINVSIAKQHLTVLNEAGMLLAQYPVSTAHKGAGEQKDSYQTPRGLHVIRAKIGAGQPINSVFSGRRCTGEIWTPQLAAQHPGRDWILTRILWLSGCEPGLNRLGSVDSMQRYIYIHGTPDNQPVGSPHSHGCVRMRNADVLELFELAHLHTPVLITED